MVQRMRWLVVLAVVLLACSPVRARAAGPQPLAFTDITSIQRDNYIEQQTSYPVPADHSLWVINPTGCQWDVDDRTQWLDDSGYLNAGASASVTACAIADPNPFYIDRGGLFGWWTTIDRWAGTGAWSSSPNLNVSLCITPPGSCRSAVPVYDAPNHRYVYAVCASINYQAGDPEVVDIPGSQGGVGVVTSETFTVSNPTNKKVSNIFADAEQIGYGGPLTLTCPTATSADGHVTWRL